ncbi:YchF/TatD family DNA exonuclease [Blochmannia endosymbiont of Camponotus (Colobopsis) obliquus]|uniref:YchF/TatD family DNA exonuclease n=1 Tax=Blochmannia endosymbiont of Camponotus (Colobopsis) obliquus TaxID=1505597 RepID=UPI00061A7377|nr:YchF/TatD family DNA exonuclease [Blochmannia endosymbiont of Camponotus (Colobopsis) obliquus]AKC60558.1 putative deoxyribonuclease YcfH [Blochmannia endosymbiont of Camponotus (Colobopsis) obliquus]
MFLIDSHCHLDKLNYETLHKDVTDVLDKAQVKNVALVLTVATTLMDFYKIKKIVGCRDDVLFSCGIHPLNLDNCYDIMELRRLSCDQNVVALGETGLDYYHSTNNKDKQKKMFREHVRIACEHNKPLIVHTRHACQDTLNILYEEQASKCGGVVHCYSEDKNAMKLLLDIGFYISFSGIITFGLSESLQEAIQYVPLDSMLIETDAPYLSPVPYRGQENQPAYVYYIAKHLAKLKNITLEYLSDITTNNFCRLFNVKKNFIS